MPLAALPAGYTPPETGWLFAGLWPEADAALISQTLKERVLHPTQARSDTWLFIAHEGRYYAHSPKAHEPGWGYSEDEVGELAETLWGHYFMRRLGPLILSSSLPEAPPAPAPETVPSEPDTATVDFVEAFERSQQALEHFHTALALIREGDYAAAKREMEISLRIDPPSTFYDYKRVETLGDVESYLGDDSAAERHYKHSLTLATHVRDTWAYTELRLKLAWCALRRDSMEDARAYIDDAVRLCERGRAEDGGNRRLNYEHGLALATLADFHLHQFDLDAALATAREAATIAARLGQSYEDKTRLYAYLAWQLYLHGEVEAAREHATRAAIALGRWLPVETTQTQALRTTLTMILGSLPAARAAKTEVAPSPQAMVAEALAAVRSMGDWVKQTDALHALAPLLEPGQLRPPYADIIAWSDEERAFFRHHDVLLRADLALAMPGQRAVPAATIRALLALRADAFRSEEHEYLQAKTLVRLRAMVEGSDRRRIERRIESCAREWCAEIGATREDRVFGPMRGLAVLLPHLGAQSRSDAVATMEACLTRQLAGGQYFPSLFLATLPPLAKLGAGGEVFETAVRLERSPPDMWIACLEHAVTRGLDELREALVEATLRALKLSATYGSTTVVADAIGHLAPYLRGDEVHQALALATPVRAIAPRVAALAAVALALPVDERPSVIAAAWKAAHRSKNADTTGEALTELVVRVVGKSAAP